MKNKQFRQSLIDVQCNASPEGYSSLLELMSRIRMEDTIGTYCSQLIKRQGKLKNDEDGRGMVAAAIGLTMERCREKGIIE